MTNLSWISNVFLDYLLEQFFLTILETKYHYLSWPWKNICWCESKLERCIENKLKRIPITLDNFQPNSLLCQRINSEIFIRRNQSGQNLPITQAFGRCSTIQRNYLYCRRFWSYKHFNLGNYWKYVKIRNTKFGIRFWIKYLKPLFNVTTNYTCGRFCSYKHLGLGTYWL